MPAAHAAAGGCRAIPRGWIVDELCKSTRSPRQHRSAGGASASSNTRGTRQGQRSHPSTVVLRDGNASKPPVERAGGRATNRRTAVTEPRMPYGLASSGITQARDPGAYAPPSQMRDPEFVPARVPFRESNLHIQVKDSRYPGAPAKSSLGAAPRQAQERGILERESFSTSR